MLNFVGNGVIKNARLLVHEKTKSVVYVRK